MNHRETMKRLHGALHQIDAAYAILAKRHGLTFNALMMVYLMGESEEITQAGIGEALRLPKSTVHSMVLDFLRQGHARLEAGSNQKEKYLVLTEAGRAYVQSICDEILRMEAGALASMGEEACALLAQTAEALGRLLNQEIEATDGEEG